MKKLTIESLKGHSGSPLVAQNITLTEKTELDVKSNSIMVFLISGYCNGTKIEEARLIPNTSKVDPTFVTLRDFFKCLFGTKEEKELQLELIETAFGPEFHYQVKSCETGEKYKIRDSDGFNKPLQVDVKFNYCVDKSEKALSQFLSYVGRMSLEFNFLNNMAWKELKENIEEAVQNAVREAIPSKETISSELSSVKKSVEEKLNENFKELNFCEYGIKVSNVKVSVQALPESEWEKMLTIEEKKANGELNVQAEENKITNKAKCDRHMNQENHETKRQAIQQQNEIKECEGEGKLIDAATEADVKRTMDKAESDRYINMPGKQILVEKIDLNKAIQSGFEYSKRSGAVVSGRDNCPNPVIQLLNGVLNGSGSQTQQVEDVKTLDSSHLSEEKDKSTEMKDGEFTTL